MNIKNFTNNGTVNEVYDSVVAISPQGQQIQQNNVGQPKPASPETPAPSQVHLNTKRSTKLNFFRVIKALCDQGFFVDASGAKADDKDVFEALSPALNDDFSDYSGHLSEGLNHHKLDTRSEIFQKLRDTYEAYEMGLLEQRKNR
ncbi:MAG: hypothetical protein II383_00560 [Bacteroidales bacterium]|nr:hypothetical protein [Bacteroidales bacterium]